MRKIALFVILVIAASCQQPTGDYGISPAEEYISVETEPVAVPEKARQEVKMERIVEMQPMPDRLGYLFVNGILRGISTGTGRPDIVTMHPTTTINGESCSVSLDEFFRKDGALYFSFTDRWIEGEGEEQVQKECVHRYKQEGQTVTELETELHEPPVSERLEGTYGDFVFSKYDWEGEPFNRLMRGDTLIGTTDVYDSAVLTDHGLLYSHPSDVSRKSGVYWMGNNDWGGPPWICAYGRIW